MPLDTTILSALSPTRGNREEWFYGSTILFRNVLAPSRVDQRRPALTVVVAQLPQFWSAKPQYHLGEQAARHPCVCQLAPSRELLWIAEFAVGSDAVGFQLKVQSCLGHTVDATSWLLPSYCSKAQGVDNPDRARDC